VEEIMKIDMHCHTKEGSLDAKVSIEKYILKLVEQGFDGMLVTDHNSYKGYQKFKEIAEMIEQKIDRTFVVLKGIEYDTLDGGHVIAVLPEHMNEKMFEVRGMTIAQLEKMVHALGGILGCAHPFGTGYFAFANTRFGKNHQDFLRKVDFIETGNACIRQSSNQKAEALAKEYHKVCTAGSDAHNEHIIGTAYTLFEEFVHNNDELIQMIKDGKVIQTVCNSLELAKKKNFVIEKLGIIGYWIYNKLGAIMNRNKLKNIKHIFDKFYK
jgi:predicted metal-dependent phosphoesterase TrpH